MESNRTGNIVGERTIDLLQHTSSSIQVHLEQVDGWLKLARLPGEPDFWRVDAVAGPIGALADVYGRLTLLAHVTGTYDVVNSELQGIMEGLDHLLSRLLSGDVSEDESRALADLAEQTRGVYKTVVLEQLPG